MVAHSTCGRIACYGIRVPGQALRCPKCGSSLMVFHRVPVAPPQTERVTVLVK